MAAGTWEVGIIARVKFLQGRAFQLEATALRRPCGVLQCCWDISRVQEAGTWA